jgi:hypothetical protein
MPQSHRSERRGQAVKSTAILSCKYLDAAQRQVEQNRARGNPLGSELLAEPGTDDQIRLPLNYLVGRHDGFLAVS